ncbi:Mediator complexsubunit Med10 [Penicillium lividum]|nr:Mediator complexsubunit Med10 [Penicillium lividum]
MESSRYFALSMEEMNKSCLDLNLTSRSTTSYFAYRDKAFSYHSHFTPPSPPPRNFLKSTKTATEFYKYIIVMAPVTLKTVDADLKEAIQHLFEIQSAVHGYLGPETQQELVRKIKNLTITLSTLSSHTQETDQTDGQSNDPSNPSLANIYTREFVELVQRGNQDLKGKREAFAGFRDVLAREMRSAMPDCRGEVDRVVTATGGSVDRDGSGAGAGAAQGQ